MKEKLFTAKLTITEMELIERLLNEHSLHYASIKESENANKFAQLGNKFKVRF